MKLSERLKILRKEAGYTQKQISELANISQSFYSYLEKGQREISGSRLERLAKVLGVSVGYLLGETETKSESEINSIMSQLHEARQIKTINYARKQLEEQKLEKQIIQIPIPTSLIPYNVEEENALSAGDGEGYTSLEGKQTVYWDKEVDYDRAIWIKGDSMEPDFHYGEVALIKYQNCYDFPGQVCAVDDVERGQAYIKSVRIIDDYLVLHSLNDSVDDYGNLIFPDKYIPLSDNPRIIGKVVDHFIPIEK